MAKIAFIGGGNMSTCIFNSIIKHRYQEDSIIVSGPHIEKLESFSSKGAQITSSNIDAVQQSEVIFLGVKPQVLPDVLDEIAQNKIDLSSKLIISMAAGFRAEAIYNRIGQCHLIRIMPNTPTRLDAGVTGIYYGSLVTDKEKKLASDLLGSMGLLIETSEEGINSIGAVAGSAPAFMYRFMESLINETIKQGFSSEEARKIIEQMTLGTALMVINNQDTSLGQLREAVTSKGGTTFQGLRQMTEYKFEEMMSNVIAACLKRTHEFEDMFK